VKKITVYSNPSCQQCDATKRYLTKKGIEFQAEMLADHPKVLADALANGYTSAPVVVVENTETDSRMSWGGFNPTNLRGLLK
jgi:glutaredoxin-like protein NrdH